MKKKWLILILAVCLLLPGCRRSIEDLTGGDGEDPVCTEWLEQVAAMQFPPYFRDAAVPLNGGKPFFETKRLDNVPGEVYYALDDYGRCTCAEAVLGRDQMPEPETERGDISDIHPTGWRGDRYSFIEGGLLYNRCHLIAWQLTGQDDNKKNLITGTRFLNTEGMEPFENAVADYIRETDYHVYYRVTPVFSGDDLLASGVLMEAWSIEDFGEGVCFCVYCYNIQPGVTIDYRNGRNHLSSFSPTV